MSELRVFVFSAGFGLPTTGPFALKLEAWLRMAGIDYERVYEDDSRKGPKGKNPWIELRGERLGDTELIIERLARERGADLDARLSPRERAIALCARRTVEEHLHQVLEWELFVHDAGWAEICRTIDAKAPWALRPVLKTVMRGHFKKQLHARGVARHSREDIAAMGKADLDALEVLYAEGPGPFLFGDQPCLTDASVFGLVGPFVKAPIEAPVMRYAKTRPALCAFVDEVLGRYFWPLTSPPVGAHALRVDGHLATP